MFTYLHLYVYVCIYVCVHAMHDGEGQRSVCASQFSPPTTRAAEIKLLVSVGSVLPSSSGLLQATHPMLHYH